MTSQEFDENWFIVEVKMKLENFFTKFKSTSHYYRCLSQGNWHFLKLSNRLFFRSFSNGMYRSVIDGENVSIIFFLRVKNNVEKYRITKELTIRMKKLMNSPIQVYGINEMNETDRNLLSSKNGLNFYNRILSNKKRYCFDYTLNLDS
jgi:hypothetical protein